MLFQVSTPSSWGEVFARRICIYPVLALNYEEFVTYHSQPDPCSRD